MKQFFAFLALLAVTGLALADPAPNCIPSNFGGTGTAWVMVRTTAGTGVAYKCPDGSRIWYAVSTAYKGPSPSALVVEATKYPTYLDAVKGMWAKYDAASTDPGYLDLMAKTKAKALAIK